MPACALPYVLWRVVNNVGISSIKIDKLSQEYRTAGPELATVPVAFAQGGKSVPNFLCFDFANINKK